VFVIARVDANCEGNGPHGVGREHYAQPLDPIGSSSGRSRFPVQPPYDVYFSADVETDGPIPGRFSMLSFGLALAGRFDGTTFDRTDPRSQTFYRELKPITEGFDPETARVSGLDRDQLRVSGEEPADAMRDAARWVSDVAGEGTPILVAFPLSFDWSFLYWYFVAFADGASPFGHASCLDMKTAFAIRARRPIALSGASRLPDEIRASRPHEHHALADAVEQAEIFQNILERAKP
jgi:hypothetical protein